MVAHERGADNGTACELIHGSQVHRCHMCDAHFLTHHPALPCQWPAMAAQLSPFTTFYVQHCARTRRYMRDMGGRRKQGGFWCTAPLTTPGLINRNNVVSCFGKINRNKAAQHTRWYRASCLGESKAIITRTRR